LPPDHVYVDAGLGQIYVPFVNESLAPPELSPRLELSRLFSCSIQSLRDIISMHAGRQLAASAVIMLLWPYLHRVAKRFEALVRRVEAGTLARPRAVSLAPRLPRFGPPCLRRPGLPTSFAWLVRLVPHHAACIGGQVRYLLVKPEMAALFIAAPQVGRIFRPLCRMLAIAPGPDLPPGLFKPRVRRRLSAAHDSCGSALTPALSLKREREKQSSALTPALSPEREREKQISESNAGMPVSNWTTTPGDSLLREARPRLPVFREMPA
jgi:hypothetical protein